MGWEEAIMSMKARCLCGRRRLCSYGSDGGIATVYWALCLLVDDDRPGDGMDALQFCHKCRGQILVIVAIIESECSSPGGGGGRKVVRSASIDLLSAHPRQQLSILAIN